MKNKYRITNNKFSHLPLVIFVLFVIGILSLFIPQQAFAVTVNVLMDGTNQIIYDNNGAKMPTGEALQILYASGEAIHSPGLTGEATGGDSIIWTGSVGQGGLGDGAFVKAFAGSHSLINGSRIYVRAWNGPSIESSTYYGDSQLSSTLDAGAPPMPLEWHVPTFYASTELAALFAPSAPGNATLEALGTTSMKLTWHDNSNNEQGFRIERSTSEAWTGIVTATVEANITSYEADGLSTNEAYWFRVYAFSAGGSSGYATAESIYTLANAPVKPSVLGVHASGYNCVVSWESGGAQSGFEVYRNGTAKSGGTLIYTGGATATVDANLPTDQFYIYYIYAYNGDNILTTYVSSADSATLPGTPEGLVTTNITTDTAYGTWETVSGAGYFVIRYGTQEAATDALVITDEAAYTFTMLSPATEYFWKVAAVNVNGTGEYSSTASFTTEAIGGIVPNLPTGLGQYRSDGITVIATGEWLQVSTVEFRMTMSSPVASTLYPEVEIELVGTDFTGIVTATGEGVSYSGSAVTGIVTLENIAEAAYHWQAKVRDAAGHSGSWASFGGNTDPADRDFGVDMTPPTLPTLQSPLPGAWLNTQTPTFEWIAANDAPSGLAKYELWIDSVKNKDVSSLETSATPEASLSDGLHTWEVKAVDYAGNVCISASSWEVNIDTVALAISLITPESNATGVFLFPNIMATFNKGLTASTVTPEYFEVTGSKTGVHSTYPSYNDSTQTVTFNQAGIFATSETVTCTVDAGVQDKAGNPMAYPYTWTFMTTSEAPPATNVTIKVYLQGYYNVSGGTQIPATIEVHLRQGSDPGSAHSLVASQEISLDATGTGTADIIAPAGSFYVEVQHTGISFESNHLSVITNGTKNFGSGPVTVDLADGTDPAYTPTASPSAEWTETNGKLSMRGGNANGDQYIRIDDFGIWLAANGKNAGESGFDPRADFDGDGLIRITDFGIWLSNNGLDSYAPVP